MRVLFKLVSRYARQKLPRPIEFHCVPWIKRGQHFVHFFGAGGGDGAVFRFQHGFALAFAYARRSKVLPYLDLCERQIAAEIWQVEGIEVRPLDLASDFVFSFAEPEFGMLRQTLVALGGRQLLRGDLGRPFFQLPGAVVSFLDRHVGASLNADAILDARVQRLDPFGGVGVTATSPDELSQAVKAAFASGKPTLVNAVIDEKAGTESGRIGNLNPQSVVAKKT